MYLNRLALTDFRCYASADLHLEPGVTAFTGANGQGKTNLVEAGGYVATLASHRVATDAPLIRQGAERAVLRAAVTGATGNALVEVELNPGRANRVRLNRAPLPRPRDILGTVRTVLFAPEERQKAIALMASATFISFPIGPIVGGYLLDHFWWGSVFLINVPVVALALIAVAFLLPESRSEQRPSVDIVGVIASSAGLAGLTYGFIKAGQNGWTNVAALATIAAGVVVLAVFVAWERRITRRFDGQPGDDGTGQTRGVRPLIELRLFRSAGFTWGTALATLVSFAMFGILFAMPQYFQEVRGVNAMGSGLRLLPMIGGMVIGMIGGTRMASPRKGADGAAARAPLANVKTLVTVGFTLMAATLAAGATTTINSGTEFAAAWFAVFGLGLGLAMPQTMNAALSALSAERSGSGAALISALRQAGATIGVAVLGTVLDSVYRGHLVVTHLPAAAAATARNSVVAGVELAHALRSAALLGSARSSFVAGMDAMLWVCAGIALVSAVLALVFLPRRAEGTGGAAVAPAVASPEAGPVAASGAGESASQRAELEV